MSDMKLMNTEDELRFCKDVHKILDDAKKLIPLQMSIGQMDMCVGTD